MEAFLYATCGSADTDFASWLRRFENPVAKPRNPPIKRVAEEIRPSQFLDHKEYLRKTYEWLKTELGTYSFIQFSADLGLSKTNVVHLVIRGKRFPSPQSVERICDSLQLSPLESHYLKTLVRYAEEKRPAEREELFEELLAVRRRLMPSPLDRLQLEYYNEWYHPVVREVVGMSDFRNDPDWIADQIEPRVTPEQVKKSLSLLESIGLIRFDEGQGRYVQTADFVSTGEEVKGLGIVRYHQRAIEIAKEAITRIPGKRRDISSLTVLVNEECADRIKAEIKAFRKKILALTEGSGEMDQIYQLNIQLFPFTKEKKKQEAPK